MNTIHWESFLADCQLADCQFVISEHRGMHWHPHEKSGHCSIVRQWLAPLAATVAMALSDISTSTELFRRLQSKYLPQTSQLLGAWEYLRER